MFHLVDTLVVDDYLDHLLVVLVDAGFHSDLFGRNVTFLAVDVHLSCNGLSFYECRFVERYPHLCFHRN